MCVPDPAIAGSKVVPVTPFPAHEPTPKVEVVKAVDKLILGLVEHKGLIAPVIVDGTYFSTGTIAVVDCKHPTPP